MGDTRSPLTSTSPRKFSYRVVFYQSYKKETIKLHVLMELSMRFEVRLKKRSSILTLSILKRSTLRSNGTLYEI